MKQARITAPYATVKIIDPLSGKETVLGFYEGGILPETADPENVASLVARGYAEYLDAAETRVVEKQKTAEEKATEDAAKARAAEAEAAAKKIDDEKATADKAAAKTAKAEAK